MSRIGSGQTTPMSVLANDGDVDDDRDGDMPYKTDNDMRARTVCTMGLDRADSPTTTNAAYRGVSHEEEKSTMSPNGSSPNAKR